MERKVQVCLSAIIMYAIVGFAGSINQVSNYWFVFILSLLVTMLTLSNIFFTDEELKKSTRFEWISVCAFFVVEIALTICIGILKLPFIGFFGIFNLSIQAIGLLFTIVGIIRFGLVHTRIIEAIKSIRIKKQDVKMNIVNEEVLNEEVAIKVEEAIVSEEVQDEFIEAQEEVYESVAEEVIQEDVLGIALQEELEIVTPYMEEEM